jgi:hypothetical protein
MNTTSDGGQLSPCVKLFIELLLETASTITSSDAAVVRQPEEVATNFLTGVSFPALISGGGR